MSTLTDQPTNPNFLSPLGFKFTINKTPNINYYVQAANIPSVALGSPDLLNPFVRIPIPGDQIQYGELNLSFKVDEDMKNYLEIYNWLIALGFPDAFTQYEAIASKNAGPISGLSNPLTGAGVYSDATLTVLSSAMNPIHQVTFIDCFPTTISDLNFNSIDSDVNYLTCQTTFRYRSFSITTL